MIPIRDDQPRFSVPFVNYFIIALNSVVYLFEYLIERQDPRALNDLIYQFAVVPRLAVGALTGVPHFNPVAAFVPIVTSMFLHGSFWHILSNMWVLWIFGDNIEDHLGHFKYLLFYLTCGIAASISHILLNLNSVVPTIGASGAIAGVMGAYFLLYPRARVLTWFPPIFVFYLPAWVTLGYWFVVQFLSGTSTMIFYSGQTGGVAFWAHVGGFVAGLILIKVMPERAQRSRYSTW